MPAKALNIRHSLTLRKHGNTPGSKFAAPGGPGHRPYSLRATYIRDPRARERITGDARAARTETANEHLALLEVRRYQASIRAIIPAPTPKNRDRASPRASGKAERG